MPLVLKRSGAVFLHLMKTGGTWVRAALAVGGVPFEEAQGLENAHSFAPHSGHISPNKPRFTIVRNPYHWYQSFWMHRQTFGWGGDLLIGHDCEDPSFEGFIYKVFEQHAGFLDDTVTRLYAADYFLNTDTVVDGLCSLLKTLGEVPFYEREIRTLPKINLAEPGLRSKCLYTPETASMIWDSEQKLFTRFRWPEESWQL